MYFEWSEMKKSAISLSSKVQLIFYFNHVFIRAKGRFIALALLILIIVHIHANSDAHFKAIDVETQLKTFC